MSETVGGPVAASGPRTRDGVVGVILAGGQARRMGGGDKGRRRLGGTPMLTRVVRRFGPQVIALALSANGDPARFDDFALPVLADPVAGAAGPLAGILAGLEWGAAAHPDCAWLATAASDAPFLPPDLVSRLVAARAAAGAEIALAGSGGRQHPVFGLWPVALAAELRAALAAGDRRVGAWAGRHRLAVAAWPGGAEDPFFNVNTLEDLAEAERRLAAGPAG